MPLPGDLTLITVTGNFPSGSSTGAPATGRVLFEPTAMLVDSTGQVIIPLIPIPAPISAGRWALQIITTDNATISPPPGYWAWTITFLVDGAAPVSNTYLIPHTYGSTVDISELTPAQPGELITTYAQVNSANTFTATNTFDGPVTLADGLTLGTTPIETPPGGTTEYLRADGTWDVPAGGGGGGAVSSVFNRTGTVSAQTGDYDLSQIGTPTANYPMSGFKFTGLGNGSGPADSAAFGQIPVAGTTGGTYAAGNDARITGALQAANNLSDVGSEAAARTNLGLGSAATVALASLLQAANNLSDLASASAARTNLGLGGAATENVGTGAGTVAAGNDSRITGALQAGNNLSDLASASSARANLGLGSAALVSTASLLQAANNLSDLASASAARGNLGLGSVAVLAASAVLQAANNLGDLASPSTARTNLGLGTAATVSLASLLQAANNLSDLASASSARSNLGLGSAALLSSGSVLQTANDLSELTATAATARTNLGLGTAATAGTATTSAAGIIQLDGTATDIQALGAQAAGSSGLAADAKHVHPTTGLAVIDTTAADIQPLGAQAAGSVGKAADAGHVHPTTGVAVIDTNASDIAALGTQAAGSVGKAADSGHVHPTTGVMTTFNPSAARWNLKSETIQFYSGNLSGTLTSGTLFLMLMAWPANVQISKLSVYVTSIGATLTGVNQLALYSSSGTLLSTTGDMTANFGVVGWQEGTLATPQTPTVDTTYYVGILTHGGTAPKIWGFNMTLSPGAINSVYPAIDFASQTSHATFTPSSGTLNSGAYWVGAR